MEYIEANEFLNQNKEVQKVFLDWWTPSEGDLFMDVFDSGVIRIVSYYDEKLNYIIPFSREFKSYISDCIPLFTEGQLREFIEEELGSVLDINHYESDGYSMYAIKGNKLIKKWEMLGCDLLQAYWKVAVKIAKEIS